MYIYHHHRHSKPNHRIMKYAQMFRKPPKNKYSHTSINYRYSQRSGKSKKYRHSNQNASFESKPNYSVTKKPWQPTENVLNPIKHAYFNYVTNGRTLAGSLNTNHFRASNYYRGRRDSDRSKKTFNSRGTHPIENVNSAYSSSSDNRGSGDSSDSYTVSESRRCERCGHTPHSRTAESQIDRDSEKKSTSKTAT